MTFHIQAMHPDKLPAYKIHLSFIGHSTRTFPDNKPRNRSVYSKIFQSDGGKKESTNTTPEICSKYFINFSSPQKWTHSDTDLYPPSVENANSARKDRTIRQNSGVDGSGKMSGRLAQTIN